MKRIAAAVLLTVLLLSLTACSGGSTASGAPSGSPVNSQAKSAPSQVVSPDYPKSVSNDADAKAQLIAANPLDADYTGGLKAFSYKTASQVLSGTKENLNYSPVSLYFALALAGTGANGRTQNEILSLLGVKDAGALSTQSSNLFRLLYTDNDISKIKIANSVWMQNKMKFNNAFIDNAKKNFYASLYNVDFADPRTAELMAKWISDNTNGTIKPDLQLSDSQIMSILNTVYFYDEWVYEFNRDDTAPDTFYLTDGSTVQTDFMNMDIDINKYAKGDGYLRSYLQMKSGESMVFILPDKGISVDEFLSSPEKLKAAFEGGDEQTGKVIFKVPKFSFDNSFDLKEPLKKLGIEAAFGGSADFTGISSDTAQPIYISDVRQQTHIKINEKSAEASALTQISLTATAIEPAEPIHMILDRPFIFGITSQDGTLLFVGVCENPSK